MNQVPGEEKSTFKNPINELIFQSLYMKMSQTKKPMGTNNRKENNPIQGPIRPSPRFEV